MKFLILSKEKDLLVLDDKIAEVSVLLRFIKNQVYLKKNRVVVLNFNLINSQILLKLIEFCKYQYIKTKKTVINNFSESNFENILETYTKSSHFQWYKNLTIFKQKIKFSWMEAIDEMYLKLKDAFKLI